MIELASFLASCHAQEIINSSTEVSPGELTSPFIRITPQRLCLNNSEVDVKKQLGKHTKQLGEKKTRHSEA